MARRHRHASTRPCSSARPVCATASCSSASAAGSNVRARCSICWCGLTGAMVDAVPSATTTRRSGWPMPRRPSTSSRHPLRSPPSIATATSYWRHSTRRAPSTGTVGRSRAAGRRVGDDSSAARRRTARRPATAPARRALGRARRGRRAGGRQGRRPPPDEPAAHPAAARRSAASRPWRRATISCSPATRAPVRRRWPGCSARSCGPSASCRRATLSRPTVPSSSPATSARRLPAPVPRWSLPSAAPCSSMRRTRWPAAASRIRPRGDRHHRQVHGGPSR